MFDFRKCIPFNRATLVRAWEATAFRWFMCLWNECRRLLHWVIIHHQMSVNLNAKQTHEYFKLNLITFSPSRFKWRRWIFMALMGDINRSLNASSWIKQTFSYWLQAKKQVSQMLTLCFRYHLKIQFVKLKANVLLRTLNVNRHSRMKLFTYSGALHLHINSGK